MKTLSLFFGLALSCPHAFAYFGGGSLRMTKVLTAKKVVNAELALAEKNFSLFEVHMLDDDGSDGSFAFQLRFKQMGGTEIQRIEGHASEDGDNSVDVYTLTEPQLEPAL